MKNLIIFGVFVLLLAAAQFASGQTVDEVIDKYIKARGGKDKLASINSIYMEGSREMMGNEVVVKITKEQEKLSRTEFEIGGTNGYLLVTENEGWSFFPMRSPEPSKMPGEVVAAMQIELDIAGPLIDYVAKGHKAELIGKDSVDGNTCYKIKLITRSGKEVTYWIDTHTYLLTQSSAAGGMLSGKRREAEERIPGGGTKSAGAEKEMILSYKDYKEVDGIQFAHSIDMKNGHGENMGGATTFDKIVVNMPVDPQLYKH